MLGAEKLRLPRLPEEPPRPALAQALCSIRVKTPRKNRVENSTEKKNLVFFFISSLPP
jgi:hypothetical protein